MRLWLVVGLGLVGCRSENEISKEPPAFGLSNPREVEAERQIDRITQVTIPSVDILFIVDNSCSMDEEQEALGTNFPAFMSWFLGSGLDYHIGVASTDMRDPDHAGRLQERQGVRWIDADTPSPEGLFAQMVALGTDGSPTEEGRAAAYTAIELLAEDFNLGFVRPDAGLHITVVSDENDRSHPESPISIAEFVSYLQTIRFGQQNVSFSSIVVPSLGCPDQGSAGLDYITVTNQVGGVVWPICSDDWTAMLDELGLLAVGLRREFFLSQLPRTGTLSVTVEANGVVAVFEEGTGWTYSESRNSILLLDYVPDPGAVVVLEYDVASGAAGSVLEETVPN